MRCHGSRGEPATDLDRTPAGWYAVVISVTMFQFLLGLGLWKWLLWTLFAFKLSRMKLKLIATHPDGHGGLGFLSLTPIGFTPVVCRCHDRDRIDLATRDHFIHGSRELNGR